MGSQEQQPVAHYGFGQSYRGPALKSLLPPASTLSGTASIGTADVSWGRWNQPYSGRGDGNKTGLIGGDYIYSDELTPYKNIQVRTGEMVFSRTLGQQPLLQDGGVRVIEATAFQSQIKVDFDQQRFTGVSMSGDFKQAGSLYQLRAGMEQSTGFEDVLYGAGAIDLTGTVIKNGVPVSVSGGMSADFVGKNADGIISSFGVKSTDGQIGVSGAGGYTP